MADEKVVQAIRKLRKAVQVALSSVELEPDDLEGLGEVFDPFDPQEKYKKGEICTHGGRTYICIKTTKRGAAPDADSEHWAPFGDDAGETDPEQPDPEPEQPDDDYPVWEQPADSKSGYRKGDRVHYPDEGGPVYESDKNKNTDVPGESDAWFEV